MLLIVAGWILALLRAQAADTSLIEFELDSHDRQTYTHRSWTGRPLLVFVSSREAATHNAGLVWSSPLAAAVATSSADVMLVRVSTLPRGLPRLFAGMVRDALAPADGDPIRIALLDWEGLFAQRYDLAEDSYNVLLFGRNGKLMYRAALQAFDAMQLEGVVNDLKVLAGQL
jgi:hypothetical protein